MMAPQAATCFRQWVILPEKCSGADAIMQAEMNRDIISAPCLILHTLWPFPLHMGHGFLRTRYRQQTMRRNVPCPQPQETPKNKPKPSHGAVSMPKSVTSA